MTVTTFSTSVWSTGTDPVYTFVEDGDEVRVLAGVTLHSRAEWIIDGRTASLEGLKATIDGTVLGWGWAALDALDSSVAITVGSTGSIRGGPHGVAAIYASRDSSLVNHGTVVSPAGMGVAFLSGDDTVVENHGTIRGGTTGLIADGSFLTLFNDGTIAGGAGFANGVHARAESTFITNLGTISSEASAGPGQGAAIRLDGGDTRIVNEGTIEAAHGIGLAADLPVAPGISLIAHNSGTISGEDVAVALGAEGDYLRNGGTIDGDVMLGNGPDEYAGEGGRLVGVLHGEGGNDALRTGLGNDTVYGGAGVDTLDGGSGFDVLSGGEGADWLYGGKGQDVFLFETAAEARGDRIAATFGNVAF